MTANTIEANKLMNKFDAMESVWLFGYGSLIFKADFPYMQRRPATIQHWVRRFWQGSHDHRGTRDAPGRVVTLVREHGATCRGVAYLIAPSIFDRLDFREKNGYLRFATTIAFDDDSGVEGLVYIATEQNPAFLGPASESEIARHIASSTGPSGSNLDYLHDLANGLRQLYAQDPHVFTIERHVAELLGS